MSAPTPVYFVALPENGATRAFATREGLGAFLAGWWAETTEYILALHSAPGQQVSIKVPAFTVTLGEIEP